MTHLNRCPSADRSAAPAATDPFDMRSFVMGRQAVNPATGEHVLSIAFSNDGIEVTLQDPRSHIVRTSNHYRHDGTHKHLARRNLRLVPLPPPKRQMRLEVVKLDNGSFTARCLGLVKDPALPREMGERVLVGYSPGVTVYVHDFEVDA